MGLAYDSYNHEEGEFNEEGEFMKYLEEPMMFSLKRGLLKNMIVSMDEPKCVTKIKKLLFGELQNVNSTFGLKFLKRQPILAVLRATLTYCRKKEIAINFSSIYHFKLYPQHFFLQHFLMLIQFYISIRLRFSYIITFIEIYL